MSDLVMRASSLAIMDVRLRARHHHPKRDVDQTKGATADAVKSSYVDRDIYRMLLLMPCTASGWSYGDWHGHLVSHEMP
jgi:hypothetical protein